MIREIIARIFINLQYYSKYEINKRNKNLSDNSMEIYYYYIEKFIFNINNNINFAFAHFNDGEILLALGEKQNVSRGMQCNSKLLAKKILYALTYQGENYYPGIPCSRCFNKLHLFCKNKIKRKCAPACVFHHTKISHFHKFLLSLEGKKLYWFVDEHKNLTNFKKHNYKLDISSKFIVKSKNAFDEYHYIKKLCKFQNNSIVILLCGPLGRILAQEWFEQNNNVTYLCLGSYFDSILNNKKYNYDSLVRHRYCSECFDKKYILKKI